MPARLAGIGQAFAAAAALVKAAETEAAAITEELDTPEREALRRAFGEGSTGKGVAKAIRGSAGAMKELEDRQKSRATRLKRDALDRALLDLAAFYRDVLAVQVGARVELASSGHEHDVRMLAGASGPEATVRRIEAIMACRERLELERRPAAGGGGDDSGPGRPGDLTCPRTQPRRTPPSAGVDGAGGRERTLGPWA